MSGQQGTTHPLCCLPDQGSPNHTPYLPSGLFIVSCLYHSEPLNGQDLMFQAQCCQDPEEGGRRRMTKADGPECMQCFWPW